MTELERQALQALTPPRMNGAAPPALAGEITGPKEQAAESNAEKRARALAQAFEQGRVQAEANFHVAIDAIEARYIQREADLRAEWAIYKREAVKGAFWRGGLWVGAPMVAAVLLGAFILMQATLITGVDTAARFQTNQTVIEALRAKEGEP